MSIEGIPIKQLWAFLAWLPKYILRKKFPPETLANLLYVDLRPRHTPAWMNLGSPANFEVWLQIINLSPFSIELDRAEFTLNCGPALKATILKRQKFIPGEIAELRLFDSMTDGEADSIARIWNQVGPRSVSLFGFMEFNCDLHSFSKRVNTLEGIAIHVQNANFRAT